MLKNGKFGYYACLVVIMPTSKTLCRQSSLTYFDPLGTPKQGKSMLRGVVRVVVLVLSELCGKVQLV